MKYKYGIEFSHLSEFLNKYRWMDIGDLCESDSLEEAKELVQNLDTSDLDIGDYRFIVYEIVGKDEDGFDEKEAVWTKEFSRKVLTIYEN